MTEAHASVSSHPRDLVVILHAMNSSPSALIYVKEAVRRAWSKLGKPDPYFLIPTLPLFALSNSKLCDVAEDVLHQVDEAWMDLESPRGSIILMGHSMGALIARKVYVYACGETPDEPFESGMRGRVACPWAPRVTRLVLFAAMNRGWSISAHLSTWKAIVWYVGSIAGKLLESVFSWRACVFEIHHGAPFLTELRLQWLAMRRHAEGRQVGSSLVIQLLGSVDDMVSPQDNIDLVSGGDFVYLDVPESGHSNVIQANDSRAGKRRSRLIALATTLPQSKLQRLSVLPADHGLPETDDSVTDVVFVIHGIRDEGYWTQKIARRVVALAAKRSSLASARSTNGSALVQSVRSETSSYGYFPMLPFLLPSVRRRRVEWLMDRYAENKARFPNARFSYFGHSNGTYMLARALRDYPSVRFKNVAFAGSVVRTDYDWHSLIDQERVARVLNFVATADWVVAIFPHTFQILRVQDLGSAGHDGFLKVGETPKLFQSEYVRGTHGAALHEANWLAIAQFVLDGTWPSKTGLSRRRALLIWLAGKVAPFLILCIGILAFFIGRWILQPNGALWPIYWRNIWFALYLLFLWKVLTWF